MSIKNSLAVTDQRNGFRDRWVDDMKQHKDFKKVAKIVHSKDAKEVIDANHETRNHRPKTIDHRP